MLTRIQAFDELRRNLELTDLQETTVATRQQKVRDVVARQLTVVDDFLTGSYRRRTLIGPLSGPDVDIIAGLDRAYKKHVADLRRNGVADVLFLTAERDLRSPGRRAGCGSTRPSSDPGA